MSARVSYREATRVLAERDPVLAGLVADAGPMRIRRRTMSPFEALIQAIVYQQLAGAAARAIHGRLIAALDGGVEPEAMLALSDETLRTVGLSSAKVRSLRDLATKVLDGTLVLSPRALARQSDDESSPGCRVCAASGRGRRRCSSSSSCAGSTSGRLATSGCATGTASRGTSRRPARASSSCSVSPTDRTGPFLPGIAGAPPSSTQARRRARSRTRTYDRQGSGLTGRAANGVSAWIL
jgi:HhH-GPD superfamily base excision DNA repair protein